MLNKLDGSSSLYRILLLNSQGQAEEVGSLAFGLDKTDTGFKIWTKKEILGPDINHKETFHAYYVPDFRISEMTAEGVLNGGKYQFSSKTSGKKISLIMNMGETIRKHNVEAPNDYLDNNTFPYILPFLMGTSDEASFNVFLPSTATFVETVIKAYPHKEKVQVPAGTFEGHRFKLSAKSAPHISQFLVYCRQRKVLIKGTTANQVFELIEFRS